MIAGIQVTIEGGSLRALEGLSFTQEMPSIFFSGRASDPQVGDVVFDRAVRMELPDIHKGFALLSSELRSRSSSWGSGRNPACPSGQHTSSRRSRRKRKARNPPLRRGPSRGSRADTRACEGACAQYQARTEQATPEPHTSLPSPPAQGCL